MASKQTVGACLSKYCFVFGWLVDWWWVDFYSSRVWTQRLQIPRQAVYPLKYVSVPSKVLNSKTRLHSLHAFSQPANLLPSFPHSFVSTQGFSVSPNYWSCHMSPGMGFWGTPPCPLPHFPELPAERWLRTSESWPFPKCGHSLLSISNHRLSALGQNPSMQPSLCRCPHGFPDLFTMATSPGLLVLIEALPSRLE